MNAGIELLIGLAAGTYVIFIVSFIWCLLVWLFCGPDEADHRRTFSSLKRAFGYTFIILPIVLGIFGFMIAFNHL